MKSMPISARPWPIITRPALYSWRLLLFPFVNIAGANNADALLLVDRLSPLLCLLTPACYGLGYLRGPQLRALVHGNIRQNKRKHNAKERKAREQRVKQMEQKNKKKELI